MNIELNDSNKIELYDCKKIKTGMEKLALVAESQEMMQEYSNRIKPGEVRRNPEGSIVICNEVGEATDRKNYERMLLPATQVDLDGWHRAHSQGAGLGNEMKEGILYAPSEVNSQLQNHGIERYIRGIRDELYSINSDAKLILITETKAHEGTLRLMSIDYQLEVQLDGKREIYFDASIEVENKRDNPKVTVSVTEHEKVYESILNQPDISPKTIREVSDSKIIQEEFYSVAQKESFMINVKKLESQLKDAEYNLERASIEATKKQQEAESFNSPETIVEAKTSKQELVQAQQLIEEAQQQRDKAKKSLEDYYSKFIGIPEE